MLLGAHGPPEIADATRFCGVNHDRLRACPRAGHFRLQPLHSPAYADGASLRTAIEGFYSTSFYLEHVANFSSWAYHTGFAPEDDGNEESPTK